MSVHTYGAVAPPISIRSRSGANNNAPTNTTKPSLQTLPPALWAAAVFACGGGGYGTGSNTLVNKKHLLEILTIGAYFTGAVCAVTGPSGPRYFACSKEAKFQNFIVASSSLSARVGLSSTLATRFWSIQAIYPQLTLKR